MKPLAEIEYEVTYYGQSSINYKDKVCFEINVLKPYRSQSYKHIQSIVNDGSATINIISIKLLTETLY